VLERKPGSWSSAAYHAPAGELELRPILDSKIGGDAAFPTPWKSRRRLRRQSLAADRVTAGELELRPFLASEVGGGCSFSLRHGIDSG
jgi:hypothetical protein